LREQKSAIKTLKSNIAEMNTTTVLFTALAYLALTTFWIGFGYRVWTWVETPVPFKIPTTPAPKTLPGVAARMASEVLIFRSLFKSDRALWLGGWAFHGALLVVLIRHLRYLLYPVPDWLIALQPLGVAAGIVFLIAGAFLLLRRIVLLPVRSISLPSDYVAILLLLGIAATGLGMKFVQPVDLLAIKAFILGLVTLNPAPAPDNALFLAHFTLVLLLVAYFPFSQLVHAGGIFFSPTRNQRDDARLRRYVNPWDPHPNLLPLQKGREKGSASK
jgi:nitrate reductase gamma subunit